jgi:uncharacterized membrane protein YvbJ
MTPSTIFCPWCGAQNLNTDATCKQCSKPLPQRPRPEPAQFIMPSAGSVPATRQGEENKVKVSTVIFIVLAFIIPLWIVTFPLCMFLAYMSYKKPWSF